MKKRPQESPKPQEPIGPQEPQQKLMSFSVKTETSIVDAPMDISIELDADGIATMRTTSPYPVRVMTVLARLLMSTSDSVGWRGATLIEVPPQAPGDVLGFISQCTKTIKNPTQFVKYIMQSLARLIDMLKSQGVEIDLADLLPLIKGQDAVAMFEKLKRGDS